MTLDWYTSPDNIVWTWQQTNATIANGTYTYVYSGATTGLTTYYWRVTINDSGLHNNSFDYSFTTASTNSCPTVNTEEPTNNSIGVQLTPTCNITINDLDGDIMDLYWYESPTGNGLDWNLKQANATETNGTYSWVYTNASSYDTDYWWMVTVSDGTCALNFWYKFTTCSAPVILVCPVSVFYTFNVTWSVNISDSNADLMEWNISCNNTQYVNGSSYNNTVSINLTNLMLGCNYTLWVNVSDGSCWTNTTHYLDFTTGTIATNRNDELTLGIIIGSILCSLVAIPVIIRRKENETKQ
jgi:hypothetical protein